MNDLVSIIVPVYNAEKFLYSCFYSIIEQRYQYIEIILIDDGSIDNSSQICDELVDAFNAIVIHIPNAGVSNARNMGIHLSSGKWMFFCDSDDWIASSAISKLVDTYNKTNAKLIIGDIEIRFFSPTGQYIRSVKNENNKSNFFNLEDTPEVLDRLLETANMSSACAKLYCSNIIKENDIAFCNEQKMLEDMEFVYSYLFYIDKIYNQSEIIYYYRGFEQMDYLCKRGKDDLQNDIINTYLTCKREYSKIGIVNTSMLNRFFIGQLLMDIHMITNSVTLNFLQKKKRLLSVVDFIHNNNMLLNYDIGLLSRPEKILLLYRCVLLFFVGDKLKKIIQNKK